jgi:hypothetical protein
MGYGDGRSQCGHRELDNTQRRQGGRPRDSRFTVTVVRSIRVIAAGTHHYSRLGGGDDHLGVHHEHGFPG